VAAKTLAGEPDASLRLALQHALREAGVEPSAYAIRPSRGSLVEFTVTGAAPYPNAVLLAERLADPRASLVLDRLALSAADEGVEISAVGLSSGSRP